MKKIVLIVTIALFGGLTVAALMQHGFWGIIEPHFKTFGAGQVFADLVISLSMILIWMWRDAKTAGRRFWPWFALTLVLGAFGPLFYLLMERAEADK